MRCTGLTASWCPIHGDCTCPRTGGNGYEHDSLDDPSCPLHRPTSTHPDAPARAVVSRPHF